MPEPPKTYHFGSFELDVTTGILRKHGIRIKLQEKPFQILLMALESPGQLVRREEIHQRLWPAESDTSFERSYNTALCRLRQSLGDSPQEPRYIQTLPGRGYRFIGEVNRQSEKRESEGSHSENGPVTPGGSLLPGFGWFTSSSRRAAAVVAIVLTILLASEWIRRSAKSRTVAAEGTILVAVAPFKAIGDSTERDYLVDGLTEELVTQLNRVNPSKLNVIFLSGRERGRESRSAVQEVSRKTGAQYLLEGHVRWEGIRARITARLVRLGDQATIWTSAFERDVASVISVQADVAYQISGALSVELLPPGPAPTRAANPEAMDAYLRGRFHWNRRSPESMRLAIQYFKKAIEKDPSYAPAYAGLADCYVVWSGQLADSKPREAYPLAKAAALKAIGLDASLAEPHSTLGVVLFEYEGDYTAAEKEFRLALDLNARYATGHLWYAEFLAGLGRREEALMAIRRAVSLDPYSPSANLVHGQILLGLYRPAEAMAQFQKTLEVDPGNSTAQEGLARVYLQMGRPDLWFAEHQKLIALDGGTQEQLTAYERAYRRGGVPAGLRLRIQNLKQGRNEISYRDRYRIARLHATLGELEGALAWLERLANDRGFFPAALGRDPEFDAIRSHPRLQKLLRRMGLNESHFRPPAQARDQSR
jgi:TolB-like protein/DNA-binding winged helix-turn-helix (wHTH) protein/tetratricopeptide (TPR) repeat protein